MQEHLTVKELPDSEKPYEKCMRYGPQYLSDAELLAVILRTGTRGRTSVELAQQVLRKGCGNLLNLYDYSMAHLMRIPGIGKTKAVQLKCVAEISKRITRTSRIKGIMMSKPSTIADYYMESFRHEKREHFIVCMFDSKCHFLGDYLLSVGSVNASLVSAREVFIQAVAYQAVFIVLLHNHPSGSCLPSREDSLVTEKISECGKFLEIRLMDHIIIGDNEYYSYRENGFLE